MKQIFRPTAALARMAVLALSALPLSALPLSAQSVDDMLRVQLLSGWQTPEGHRMAALDLKLAQGWKTYWRAPGEAGIPPVFDWTGSENLAGVTLHWPSPEVIDLNGLRSIGYHERLVLPMEVTARDASKPVTLQLKMDLGLCKDICLPASVTLHGRLEGAGGPDRTIRDALAARPLSAAEAGLTGISCSIVPIEDGLRLTASLNLPRFGTGEEVVVFEASDQTIWVSQAQSARHGGAVIASTDMVATSGAPFALDRQGVIVTVLADKKSVELQGCPAPG